MDSSIIVFWCSTVMWAFDSSHGRSITADLPTSMTNENFTREIITFEQLELIIESTSVYGTNCPESIAELPQNGPLYARSNCPWYYKLSHDPDRFPASLPVAVHKCSRHCVGLPEDIRDSFTCDYIFRNMTVLMKEYSDSVPRFVEKIQPIAVGSTCVRKKVLNNHFYDV